PTSGWNSLKWARYVASIAPVRPVLNRSVNVPISTDRRERSIAAKPSGAAGPFGAARWARIAATPRLGSAVGGPDREPRRRDHRLRVRHGSREGSLAGHHDRSPARVLRQRDVL